MPRSRATCVVASTAGVLGLASPAPGISGYVVNQLSGSCLDAPGTAGSAPGNLVQLSTCDTTGSNMDQLWEFTPEGFLKNFRSEQCLELDSASAYNAEALHAPCTSGSKLKFEFTQSGHFRNLFFDKCLDVYGVEGVTGRVRLLLSECEDLPGNAHQLWRVVKANLPAKFRGYVVNWLSGKCMDVAGDVRTAKGDMVQLYTCPGSEFDQLWQLTAEGLLKNVLSELCLATSSDDGVQLAACDVAGARIWDLTSDGQLRYTSNDECLDVDGVPGTEDGSRVKLRKCEDVSQNAHQRWRVLPKPARLPPQFRGYVVNRLSGKCLDVRAGVVAANAVVPGGVAQIYTCPGSDSDQLWELTAEGFLKNVRRELCLDVGDHRAGNATGDRVGAGARITDCHSARQRWELTLDGHFRNLVSGECLDVWGTPGTEDGSRLRTGKCEDASGNTDQLWVFFAKVSHLPPKFRGYVVSQLSGKCMDVAEAVGTAEGDVVQLYTCPGSNADQLWELTADGFFRNVLSERCLDVDGAATTDDLSWVVLSRCKSKPEQTWELTKDGRLKNSGNGECLDVWGVPGTEDGSRLMVLPCEAVSQNSDQLWVFMATPPVARAQYV